MAGDDHGTVEARYGAEAATHFRNQGLWADDSLSSWVDRWARERPGSRAVSDGVRELTFAQLSNQSARLAIRLLELGIHAGDRVAIQLPNWVEFVVAYAAINRVGAILVPIMPVYRHTEVLHILQSAEPKVILTTGNFRGFDHAAMFRELRGEAPSVSRLIIARSKVVDSSFEERIDDTVAEGQSATALAAQLGPYPHSDQGHAIIYSSGTESTAKGCLHTWNTAAFTARFLARDVFRLTAVDTMFMPSPLAHTTGIEIGILAPLIAGAQIHLLDVWDPEIALARIQQFACTAAASATPFVRMVLDTPSSRRHDLSTMRVWLCAGAPIPTTLAMEFAEVFNQGTLLPLYGCTEVGVATVCHPDDDLETISTSDGRVLARGVDIKLIDHVGERVGAGQEGEICYRGPGAMLSYWRDHENTRAAIDDEGWHHCGDLGRVDADGYLRVTGRLKDIIIRGGQNLSAREIEEHLLTHPAIKDVAVVPYPDERLGEKVCAFITVQDGTPLSVSDIRSFLTNKRKVAIQKVPEKVLTIDELPRTASGKVQKFVLRKQATSTVR
ncbi:AMP-binding protein [Rhodococcus opacus]|nr:AMP-binding protein [Rhodococcus opacus]